MKKFVLFLCLVLVSLCGFQCYAQKGNGAKRNHLDTIKVKAGHFFVVEKDAYYITKDTVFVLPDTIQYYQRKHSQEGTNEFYNSLVEKLSKKKYSNLLYKLVFEKEEEKLAAAKKQESSHFEISRKSYLKYDGKKVNKIHLRELKVFGTDVDDTTKLETTFITNTINGFHFHTREKIIRNNLLLEEGSTIRPTELADNERLLRQLDYIKDARIYVYQEGVSQNATLHVVTRDVFPLKIDYSTDEETSASRIGVSNINIFGTGHENENDIVINDIGKNSLGYDGYYRVKNVGGTFMTGELNYVSTFRNDGYGIRLFRDFLTPEMLNAGGIEYSSKSHNQFRAFDNETDSIIIVSHKEDFQDIWFARSFKALHVPSILKSRERLRFVLSGRVSNRRFVERPEVREDFNEAFHHRTNILLSAGLSSRGYHKDKLIKSFGRTEDIPVGTSLQLTAGYQFGEFFDREYLGVDFAEGGIIEKFGYLKGTFKLGGFFRKAHLEQGVLNLKTEYFSRLNSLNLFKLRQFMTANYTRGIRRKSQDFIDINDANGIRGLYNFFLTGTERFVINTESVLFTPFYLGGFRTAFLAFFDIAVINSSRARDTYYGAGFGVRLKNDNLAFNTIQLRLGFYPTLPFEPASRGFNFSTIGNLGLKDFDISSPETIGFR